MHSIIQVPVADMRSLASQDTEVVSQALFAEPVKILKREAEWVLIETADSYCGWVEQNSLTALEMPYRFDLEIGRMRGHLYRFPSIETGPLLPLPYGVKLHLLQEVDARWLKVLMPSGREAFVQRGDIEQQILDLEPFCYQFLGIPYIWGGRSSFGFDCSGFVQMVYAKFGIGLPRDSKEQARDCRGKEVSLEQVKLGDLLFWGKSPIDIRHVGIALNKEKFIHSSSRENRPYLRVNSMKEREWNRDPQCYFPYLTARRFF